MTADWECENCGQVYNVERIRGQYAECSDCGGDCAPIITGWGRH